MHKVLYLIRSFFLQLGGFFLDNPIFQDVGQNFYTDFFFDTLFFFSKFYHFEGLKVTPIVHIRVVKNDFSLKFK